MTAVSSRVNASQVSRKHRAISLSRSLSYLRINIDASLQMPRHALDISL